MSQPKDWTTLPLLDGGRSLVEASAGTGKTWTIAVLYLRLLLERQLSPKQIIVSTFTNAAAAELGERLRGKLLWALAEATKHRDGIGSDEVKHPDCGWIRTRWREDMQALDADVQRLQAGLAEFDAAPISTLHALCSRILADHPFAAGALFRGREMIDGKTLEGALVSDLWRVIAQGEDSDELVVLARAADININTLKKYVPALLQANVVVEPQNAPINLRAAMGSLEFLEDFDAWAAQVRALVSAYTGANSRLRRAWPALVDAIAAPLIDIHEFAQYLGDYAGAGEMKGISKAGKEHPEVVALVGQTERISKVLEGLAVQFDLAGSVPLRQFLTAAQCWCRVAMQGRLDAANQSSFDQLLVSVRGALVPRDGQRALADALFAAWPVALVDEFQDTDPVQFSILDAIYKDVGDVPRGRLVMIGDPKQAIYRFRGGDVQAYERAKVAVPPDDRLMLGTNHRSSRGYVEAVNQFYRITGETLGPAVSKTSIAYEAVQASSRRDDAPLGSAFDNTPLSRPLVLHQIAPDDDVPNLETHALRVCAGQIAWALSEDGYRIDDKPLQPGDIAVLLPSHAQVAKLAVMLKARGVPCVTGSQKSVFETSIARDLRLMLHAVLHPDDPRTLRAALVSRLGGERLGALQALRHDAAAWDVHASRFHALRGSLERGGPLALVAALLEQHAARLLDTVEGERMLTDLRHLGELLQEAWDECGSGERLLAWFADQMIDGAEGSDAADARAMRLESDAARVKLMTLHASKGLEFGVVFLPLMWKHGRSKMSERSPHLLSDAEGSAKYLVEGPAKDVVKYQEYEERYRILYVALTRAIHACHVFVLPKGHALADAIRIARNAKDVALNELDLKAVQSDATALNINILDGWHAYPGLEWRGEAASSIVRTARALPALPTGPLPMRHSFTTLSGGGRRRVALEDSAAEDEAQAEQLASEHVDTSDAAVTLAPAAIDGTRHQDLDALATVAGADFGNAVHALFEHRVPGQPIAQDAVLAALREQGVRPLEGDIEALVAPLTRRLQKVLGTSLGDAHGPCLGNLAGNDMRAELEFNYVLDGASLRALRKTCEAHGEPGLVPVREQTLAGLMNGKIDLVFAYGGRFHVLDYKGNQLSTGPRACLEDYATQALENKMLATGYRLQALLYTVAVERYLRERLGDYSRDRHLGDCWYLFIRAVGLQLPDGRHCGVWRHRFDDDLLDAVQRVLGLDLKEVA